MMYESLPVSGHSTRQCTGRPCARGDCQIADTLRTLSRPGDISDLLWFCSGAVERSHQQRRLVATMLLCHSCLKEAHLHADSISVGQSRTGSHAKQFVRYTVWMSVTVRSPHDRSSRGTRNIS